MSDQSTTAITPRTTTNYDRIKALVKSENVQDRFRQLLNERAPEFLSGLLSLVSADKNLLDCDPASIFTAAAKAAILRLPIAKELGYAYIVPFKHEATFVIGYRGLTQLAIRTAQYLAINATEIYEGEEIVEDRLSGAVTLNGQRTGDDVIGYAAYLKLKNGFEKAIYMSREDVVNHGKRYSKSYGNDRSAWTTNFDGMGKKTVLRLLLGKYGLLSIEMLDNDAVEAPAFGEDPRLAMPKFDDLTGEMLEGEFTEPLAPPEPEVQQEESAPDLTAQIIQAAIESGYTQNEHSARNTLKHHKDEFQNLEHGVLWFKQYRSYRDQGESAAKAAELASGKIAA